MICKIARDDGAVDARKQRQLRVDRLDRLAQGRRAVRASADKRPGGDDMGVGDLDETGHQAATPFGRINSASGATDRRTVSPCRGALRPECSAISSVSDAPDSAIR